MHKLFKVAAIAAAAISVASLLSGPAEAATKKPVLKLLWHQEFAGKAGTSPSSKVFNYDLGGGGWGNLEHEAYVEDNAKLDGSKQGNLVIKATRYTPDPGGLSYPCPVVSNGDVCEFLSSRLQTSGKLAFQYGQVSARIKMPAGDGVWPAFWMLGTDINNNQWPNCGEIDIVETRGDQYPTTVFGTAHGPGYSGENGIVNSTNTAKALSAGYHVYSVIWLKNKIQWLIDGKVYHTVTPAQTGSNYVFNKPFFLIMNLAMGGNFVGGSIDPTLQEAQMSIDWIRYYSYNGVGKVSGNKYAIAAGKP